ncbi:nurim isoform X5 [Emys orbicularis]|uniref:nurim isoform X5 n=1 Tax=Emys orbicularis TaxID=82168 RepID=UPI0031FD2B25
MAAQLLLMVPALGSFLFTFGTGVELIRFASLRAVLPGGGRPGAGDPGQEGWGAALRDPRVLRPLAVDLGLVVLFVLQHSLMATAPVKRWTTSCFGVLQRSFYVFCTALALQVYYHCLGMGDPLALKSVRAVRLYSHLRHPVYLEFLLVLWAVPCLSLDRLLLAGLFTTYLSCGHSLDQQDYLYLRAQLDKKFLVFSREEAAYGDLLARNGPAPGKES